MQHATLHMSRTHCAGRAAQQRLQRAAPQPLHKDEGAAGLEHTVHLGHQVRTGEGDGLRVKAFPDSFNF